jgi:hypothetical protein
MRETETAPRLLRRKADGHGEVTRAFNLGSERKPGRYICTLSATILRGLRFLRDPKRWPETPKPCPLDFGTLGGADSRHRLAEAPVAAAKPKQK